jgi:hypothetical protein
VTLSTPNLRLRVRNGICEFQLHNHSTCLIGASAIKRHLKCNDTSIFLRRDIIDSISPTTSFELLTQSTMEKDGLPRYSAIDNLAAKSQLRIRKSRAVKVIALGCLVFLAYAQWTQITSKRPMLLSVERLKADLATCSILHHTPKDPSGPRDRNARYFRGKPTLIRNATVWTGEAVSGTTAEEARAGKGYGWIKSDILLEKGLIISVEPEILPSSLPEDCAIWDAEGRQLTAGIVDMHSHTGVYPIPELRGGSDGNELSSDITPYVRSIDALDPMDPQLQVIKSGGVTTSLILPGSGNNIGGEAYLIKHAVGKKDGRVELGPKEMLADPEQNWRYMKMACGENAKSVYGEVGNDNGPFSRMGESWYFRHAFEQATALINAQDDWCNAASTIGATSMKIYLPQDLQWEALSAALRGQVHINTHCYTIADLEAFVDHTNEFKFAVRAFHHAHQTYLVPEVISLPPECPASLTRIYRFLNEHGAEDHLQQHSLQITCTIKLRHTLPQSKPARFSTKMISLQSSLVTTRSSMPNI